MHLMRQLIAISIPLIPVLLGCDLPGGSDFEAPLANGYSVHRSNAIDIIVSPQSYDWKTPVIGATVVELDHDSTWVIAKQRPHYDAPLSGPFRYWILNTEAPE